MFLIRHAHEAAASDMKDEKPFYALRTVITDEMGSEGCSDCGTSDPVFAKLANMSLSET